VKYIPVCFPTGSSEPGGGEEFIRILRPKTSVSEPEEKKKIIRILRPKTSVSEPEEKRNS
jgi:hypothetical protein